MKPIFRLALVALIVGCMALVAAPRSAAAHPMGNFTINHFSSLTVGNRQVSIFYVLDMAEIPAYSELGVIRPNHGPDLSAKDLTQAELDAYTSNKAAELLKNLSLSIDGTPVQLSVVGKPAISFPPGVGGLPTLRFELNMTASLGEQRGTLQYTDNNYSERIGLKEIIAKPATGTKFENSSVPQNDVTGALRNYTPDLISNPPRVTSATLVFAAGVASAADSTSVDNGTVDALKQAQASQGDMFGLLSWVRDQTDAISALLMKKDVPLTALLIALLIAFGMGAAHALSPGHGKTVVAAYLVGTKGTPKHAVFLGLTVTITHTIGVFLLGLLIILARQYASNFIQPETLFPWLGFISGSFIAMMGIVLFVQRRRLWKRTGSSIALPVTASATAGAHTHSDDHTHEHDLDHEDMHSHDHHAAHSHDGQHPDHDHDHAHPHDHSHDHDASVPHKHGRFGKAHTHLPADGTKVTLGSLLALGITGGIIPCPNALVVLLVASSVNRTALGMLLIVAFSAGLAVVLTGIGLMMVYSRGLLNRFKFNSGLLSRLPMASAIAVACLGLLIAYSALSQGGVLK